MDNYFVELNKINVNDKTEKKGNLTYLSWAWAWGELKKKHPDANSKVYENEQGWNYYTDGKTAWVKTGVTVNEIEHIEYLPIMDYKNQSIPLEKITSTDVNKAIQRSMTKAIARHGLGLYIYAGEDIPNVDEEMDKEKTDKVKKMIVSETKVKALKGQAEKDGVNLMKLCAYANISDLALLTEEQYSAICNNWTKEVIPKCKD